MMRSTWAAIRLIEEATGECRDMLLYRTEMRRNRFRIAIQERTASGEWGPAQATPWSPLRPGWPRDVEQLNDSVGAQCALRACAGQIEVWKKTLSEGGTLSLLRSMPIDAQVSPLRGEA